MHRLIRQVRFAVNPFLDGDTQGHNSFCAKPAGDGLAVWLELEVEVIGPVDKKSGFVVNVVDIDRQVRKWAVPVFSNHIRKRFAAAEHIAFGELVELLRTARKALADKFNDAQVGNLGLKVNPYRKIRIDNGEQAMFYFSEKFEFAAMHKLWCDDFTEERNFEVFGKCANKTGHGHNYVLEVTVKHAETKGQFSLAEYERAISQDFIGLVDHKNLNEDVEYFKNVNPTVENIAKFAWQQLADKFTTAELDCICVWETEKTCCRYYGR